MNTKGCREEAKKIDEKFKHFVSVNLPENCPNVCISFAKEVAEMQIKEFGAKPLYGFDEIEDWLPVQVFITYGGILAPEQRRKEEGLKEVDETIINLCKQCQKHISNTSVEIVKALTDLIEVRASMPDWREKQGTSTPD